MVEGRLSAALKWLFCASVWALALYQFSENTADPDLWAHTLVGEHLLLTGKLQKVEPYSWTAPGTPWINHELLAETSLGAVHLLAGGTGILLLKILVGFLSFGIALRIGAGDLIWPQRGMTWAVGALAGVEISYGFAARPQIFTALGLAIELWLLRLITRGRIGWICCLPGFVCALGQHAWRSPGRTGRADGDHGRVGDAVMLAQVAAHGRQSPRGTHFPAIGGGTGRFMCALCRGALDQSLWVGVDSVDDQRRCLVARTNRIGRMAPHAAEFEPCGAICFGDAGVGVLRADAAAARTVGDGYMRRLGGICFSVCTPHAAVCDRRPGFRAAALVGRHSAFPESIWRVGAIIPEARRATRGCRYLLIVTTVGECAATFVLHKEHPLTMEVPRSQYPLSAIAFIRAHDLHGNLLVFFDWGEMCLWELPQCAVSIDGRWETCYPRELIPEHWKFYNDEPVDSRILDIGKADMALLPANLAGTLALSHKPGWQVVYYDNLAVVLVREPRRFPDLDSTKLPVAGPPDAALGRAPFPDGRPARLSQ